MSKKVRILVASLTLLISVRDVLFAQTELWQPTNGPYGGSVSALAVSSTGYAIAVIGERYRYSAENGVFISTDAGNTWLRTSLANTHFQALSTGPTAKIYAGTDGAGVFCSRDNGASWDSVNTGLPTRSITCLATRSADTIFAGTAYGVFRSTNDGVSWVSVNSNLTTSIVRDLVINSSDGHIFAAGWGGISRSTDNGNSWLQVFSLPSFDGAFHLAINSSGHIFASTGSGLFRSTNNGGNWRQVSTITPNAFAFDSSGNVLAGTGNGVFRSTDNGDSWVHTGLANNTVVLSLAVNSSGYVFAGTDPGGIFRSFDGGQQWTWENKGPYRLPVSALGISPSGQVYAGVYYYDRGGIFMSLGLVRSTKSGGSWIQTGLMGLAVNSLAFNSSGNMFAGTFDNGVFRSTDDGETWTQIGLMHRWINALAIDASGHIVAGTYDGVFRSTNNGETWDSVNTGLTDRDVISLAIAPDGAIFAETVAGVFRSTASSSNWTGTGLTRPDVSTLLTNYRGDIFAGTGEGIFRSTDNGDNWVQSGLIRSQVSVLTIAHNGDIRPSQRLIAGTGDGVFCSIDDGKSWDSLNSGLTNRYVQSLAVDYSGGYIFAGTWGGVYRTVLPVTSVGELAGPLPGRFELGRNYPNPFNPSSTIPYQVAGISWITLKVFDVLGREVATLVNERKASGRYEVVFDASGLSSGVYFYRLSAGSFTETRRMLLVR